MFIHDEIALQMAKERFADAVRCTEQLRAIRRAQPSTRQRLSRSLVCLGRWLAGQPPTTAYSPPAPVSGLPMAPRR